MTKTCAEQMMGVAVERRFPKHATVCCVDESTDFGLLGQGQSFCELIRLLSDERMNRSRKVLVASISELVFPHVDDDGRKATYELPAIVFALKAMAKDEMLVVVLAEGDQDEWDAAFGDAPEILIYTPRHQIRQSLNKDLNSRDGKTIPNSYMLFVDGRLVKEKCSRRGAVHDVCEMARDCSVHQAMTQHDIIPAHTELTGQA